MISADAQADHDAARLDALRRLGEALADRRKAPRATVYGWASVRAYRQVGREILKILNKERKPRRG